MPSTSQPNPYQWVWLLWLAIFYSVWFFLIQEDGAWDTVKAHWPIALSMVIGGYAAGATPMGGGTVGFPVLVLLFEMPATLGRDFSFAVQSIGMVSATIFIIARRQQLAWPMLKGAMLGAVCGTPLGILFVAPLIPDLWVKVTFAVIWGSFGIFHLYRIGEIASNTGMTQFNERWDHRLGFGIGLSSSATVVAVSGVGIDMVVYAALVLLCRVDLKIAISTAVVIMAFTSVCGALVKSVTHSWQSGVYENWLAAAPVVVLAAPLGVFLVGALGRKSTLMVVAALCVGQFVWTCFAEQRTLGLSGILIALAAVGVCLLGFEWLRALGGVLGANEERL